MAAQRKKTLRTLRYERQRGEGPPYVRDRRTVLYSVEGFRDWLRANENHPVRESQAARAEPALKPPHRGNFGHGRDPVTRGRRRALETA
jgi:hypothetical protein